MKKGSLLPILIIYFLIDLNIIFGQNDNYCKLSIKVENHGSQKGAIITRLFKRSNHMIAPGNLQQAVTLDSNSDTIVYQNLECGEYSIFAWHDQNDNGEVDRNFIGIPKENIGFSHLDKRVFRTPDFEKTKVSVKSDTSIIIKLFEYF